MPVLKITGQGLSAIALSVALLWGILVAERQVVRQARDDRAQALEQIRRLRRQLEPQPVSIPPLRGSSVPTPAFG